MGERENAYYLHFLLFLTPHAFFLKVLNSLPNDKVVEWSKFRAFADDKINVT